jgi:hypothetical protein
MNFLSGGGLSCSGLIMLRGGAGGEPVVRRRLDRAGTCRTNLLQIALKDIGQLTDFGSRPVSLG